MAPDEEVQTTAEAPEAPAEAPPQASGPAHLDAVVEKFGGGEAKPAAEPEAPAAPEPRGKSAAEVHPKFYDRVSAKRRLEAAERERDTAWQLIEAALAETQPKEPGEIKVPDFNEDPKGWYEAKMAEFRRDLQPVSDYVRERREYEQRERQLYEQRLQRQAALREMAGTVADAESEYEQTEHGQGYRDRLFSYVGRSRKLYEAIGHSPEEAAEETAANLDRLIQKALKKGWNPAAYVDAVLRQGGGGQEQAAAAAPAPRPRNPEIAAHKAAAASGVAGSLSQSGAAAQKSPTTRIRGNVTKEKLVAALAADTSGNWRQRLYKGRDEAIKGNR